MFYAVLSSFWVFVYIMNKTNKYKEKHFTKCLEGQNTTLRVCLACSIKTYLFGLGRVACVAPQSEKTPVKSWIFNRFSRTSRKCSSSSTSSAHTSVKCETSTMSAQKNHLMKNGLFRFYKLLQTFCKNTR